MSEAGRDGYQTGLGLTESFSIIIGRIIGSGIFRTPAAIMLAVSGSLSMFFGAWIVGGLFTFLSALLYAEMVALLPRAGGPYVYLRAAYPPIISFLRGWAMFFVSETASIVVVSIVFSDYFGRILYPADSEAAFRPELRFLLSLCTIWLLTSVNVLGVRFAGLFQDVLSFIKIFSLVGVILVGSFLHPHPEHFIQSGPVEKDGFEMFLGVIAALRYVFFAYSGWEGATYVAEEVKNPTKNLPLSLFLGIGTVMVLYLAANLAYLLQLSPAEVAGSPSVAATALERAAGPTGAVLISLAVVLNTFGNVNSQIFTKSRTWQAMARDGMFFRFLAPLDPERGTPKHSLLLQAAWATVLLGFAFLSDRGQAQVGFSAYERIIDFFTFTSALFNLLTYYAVLRLRRSMAGSYRPFRVPAFPLVFSTVIFVQAAFVVFTFWTAPLASLGGLLLTGTGLAYWRWGIPPEIKSSAPIPP